MNSADLPALRRPEVALLHKACVDRPRDRADLAAPENFCPADYVCIYDDANWSRLLVLWNGNTRTGRVNFANGTANRASSWQNHSDRDWCAGDDRITGDVELFVMIANNSHSYVGANRSDKADFAFRPC